MKQLIGLVGAATLTIASAAVAAVPEFPPWGFNLSGRDSAVAPGNDFYEYANGTYVKNLKIPPDRTRYGAFDKLQELSEDRIHKILDAAAADTGAGGERAKVGAFYRAFMDEPRVEQLGAKPLAPELAEIRAADSRDKIARLMARAPSTVFGSVIDVDIGVDAKDPGRYAVYVGQAGLGLPNRDYYLQPEFATQKAKYEAYVAQMLHLIDWPDADAEAQDIVNLETEIAKASWTRTQQRDPVATYNAMTPAELAQMAPGFEWADFLKGAGVGDATRVVVAEKTAVPAIAKIFAATPVKTLQAWEAFDAADSAAPYLSKPFVDAEFEFRQKTLSGQQALKARWKRGVSLLDGEMGFAVGKLYVAKYFPPEAKAKIDALVENLRHSLAGRIERVSWMSDATKAKAEQKLSMLTVKIGYPAKWRDYSALKISDDDLFGDVERATAFEWRRKVSRLFKPVDKGEWHMTPQTVNAYYNPPVNEIVFPAAILQPPFFDPAADPAVNYGAIGAVIGHEMTHGFDDSGRHFDGTGRLTDWWTAEDAKKFVAETKRLGSQYDAFEPLPGVHVKGNQTMGENIADLGGLLVALDAYHASLGGKPAPVRSGLTGDQRFFLGFAQIWRSAIRPDALKRQIVSDVHSPEVDRVNGTVRNVDDWYGAWNVKPGDALYLAPQDRVRIW